MSGEKIEWEKVKAKNMHNIEYVGFLEIKTSAQNLSFLPMAVAFVMREKESGLLSFFRRKQHKHPYKGIVKKSGGYDTDTVYGDTIEEVKYKLEGLVDAYRRIIQERIDNNEQ